MKANKIEISTNSLFFELAEFGKQNLSNYPIKNLLYHKVNWWKKVNKLNRSIKKLLQIKTLDQNGE